MEQRGTVSPSVVEVLHQSSPKPEQELRRLDVFLGKWKAHGVSTDSAPEPGKVIATDVYQWFQGGYFLISRGELRIENKEPVENLWIYGYDPTSETYPIHAFDGQGHMRLYHASVNGRTWKFLGRSERATLVFSEDGSRYTAVWEISSDGTNWSVMCELTAAKELT